MAVVPKKARPAPPPAVDVHGHRCIHTKTFGEVCGKNVARGQANGFLCAHHQTEVFGGKAKTPYAADNAA